MKNRNEIIKKVYVRKVTRIMVGFDRTNKYSTSELAEYDKELKEMYTNFKLFIKKIDEVEDTELIKSYIESLQKIMFRKKKVESRNKDISNYKYTVTRNYALIYLNNIKKVNKHLEEVINK